MEEQIKSILNQVKSKKDQLESMQDAFLKDCKSFTENEIDRIIRSEISSNPGKIKELGQDGLVPIKNQVKEAISTADSHVKKHINIDQLWLFRQENLTTVNCPFGTYMVHGNRGPDILEDATRQLINPVGEILLSNNMGSSGWEKYGDSIRYRYGIGWSDGMKDTMKTIDRHFNELYKLLEKYETLKSKVEGAEVLDLWDSI